MIISTAARPGSLSLHPAEDGTFLLCPFCDRVEVLSVLLTHILTKHCLGPDLRTFSASDRFQTHSMPKNDSFEPSRATRLSSGAIAQRNHANFSTENFPTEGCKALRSLAGAAVLFLHHAEVKPPPHQLGFCPELGFFPHVESSSFSFARARALTPFPFAREIRCTMSLFVLSERIAKTSTCAQSFWDPRATAFF